MDNLLVEYSFVAKSHGIVNYAVSSCYDDKTEWIIKVLIRNPVIKDFVIIKEVIKHSTLKKRLSDDNELSHINLSAQHEIKPPKKIKIQKVKEATVDNVETNVVSCNNLAGDLNCQNMATEIIVE